MYINPRTHTTGAIERAIIVKALADRINLLKRNIGRATVSLRANPRSTVAPKAIDAAETEIAHIEDLLREYQD